MRVNGEALRAIRQRTGDTITGLGQRAGVDRTTLSRMESGERPGTPAQIKALAKALKVPMAAIMMDDSEAVA